MAIPQEMMGELEEAFFLFDYDKDKKITSKELGAVVRSVGLNPTEDELKQMTREVDSAGGKIDVQGLCKLLSSDNRVQKQRTTRQELAEAFSVFDKAGDGTISLQDFRLSLTTLAERLSDKEVDEITRAVDQDGEGQVRITDIVSMLIPA